MLVGSRMSNPVITINARGTVQSAIELMEKESIHSLPVVDRQGRLLGIITSEQARNIVQNAKQSDELIVEDYMVKQALTVNENTPVEEAARILSDYEISSLPVLRGNYVVGIITITGLARILLELTGARRQGVRLTFEIDDAAEKLLEVIKKINELDGKIENISTYATDVRGKKAIMMKISNVEKYLLKQNISPLVDKIVDIR